MSLRVHAARRAFAKSDWISVTFIPAITVDLEVKKMIMLLLSRHWQLFDKSIPGNDSKTRQGKEFVKEALFVAELNDSKR